MTSTNKQLPILFSTRVLLVALLAAVLVAVVLFWRLGLEVRTGQAGAFVAVLLLTAFLIVEFVRRRFRLGLRGMLILVTVLCVLFAFFGNRLIQIRQQQQAINQLRELGVSVAFDYHESGEWVITESGLPMPRWIGKVFGESTYASLVDASFRGSSAIDADLAAAGPALREAIALSFDGSMITGAGLAALADCQRLEVIELGGLQLDDEGAEILSKLQTLRRVNVRSVSITDANLPPLVKVCNARQIELLFLYGSSVTDAGMQDLAQAHSVKTLFLSGTAVGDAGVARLKNMAGLRTLNLEAAAVTDAGLAHVGEMRDLEELNVRGTVVTDAGLTHLHQMTNLKRLVLPATISDEAIAELQQALPQCDVFK